ncbi:MAG: glycosyltransferase [Luteibaculaceae bacterium]
MDKAYRCNKGSTENKRPIIKITVLTLYKIISKIQQLNIVCFGPGPKFKGGIANYTVSLAKAFDALGHNTYLVSWSQQYPAIIPREFIDKTSKNDLLEGTGIQVSYLCNYNNPLSWRETARYIASLKPDLVIFQWAIAIQGLPIGYMMRYLNNQGTTTTVADLHFVIQKENSSLDKWFTQWGIGKANSYVVHAKKTFNELTTLFPQKPLQYLQSAADKSPAGSIPVAGLYHPVYKLFPIQPEFDVQAFKEKHGLKKHVFLFFGFIRKYKGLHFAIESFAKLAAERDDVSLIICGESFWNTLDKRKWTSKLKKATFDAVKGFFLKKEDSEENYNPLALLDAYKLHDRVLLQNEFVANEEVHKYFQSSDSIVLFYEYATPSGVESLSYNFKLPILATAVGHFPETVKHGYNGYLAEPKNIDSMAQVLRKSIENPINRDNVEETAKELSWENYGLKIIEVCSKKPD